MSDEARTETTIATPAVDAAGVVTPPEGNPGITLPEPTKTPVETHTAKPVAGTPTRKLVGDDGEIPTDAELIEMSPKALKSRLDRETKKTLRERFGSDDVDQIKARLDKLAEFEEREEAARLAAMSEQEKLKEQLQASEAARQAAEDRMEEYRLSQDVERGDTVVRGIVEQKIDPDYVDEVMAKVARHILSLDDDEITDEKGVVASFVDEYLEKKPKLAKDYAPPTGEKPAPKELPATNGVDATRNGVPAGAVGQSGAKTASPGKPNSMSTAEIAKMGYRW